MRPPPYLLLLGLILILAGSFAAGYSLSPGEIAAQVVAAEPLASPWDVRMLALDREALDGAYRAQLTHLFAIWMKDDKDQPRRAINGARQARHAYIEVMKEIEKRESRLKEQKQ